jgi:hypothetical protein
MRGTPIRAIVLILLLAAACAQCVAQCADTGHGVPPCHRQQQSQTPTLCQIPVLLAKDAPVEMAVESAVEPVPVLVVLHETVLSDVPARDPAPPLLLSVLRI